MRPTFMGFETAKRGVMVSQKGLDVVGHNIMNTQTNGYTRQRLDVYAVATPTYASRYASSRTWMSGQGVDAGGVSQIRDSFLDKRFREEYGDVGYYEVTSGILLDIESAISEYGLNPDEDNPMGTGLQNALQQITDALDSMSNQNADSITHATIVYTAFQQMTQVLHQFDAKLNNVTEQAKYDLGIAVDDVNSMLRQIHELNRNIAQDMAVTRASNGEYYGPNELFDKRNLLLDQLAAYGNINVESHTDGTVSVTMDGHPVVWSDQSYGKFLDQGFNLANPRGYEMLNIFPNSNGTVAINWQTDGERADLLNGSLKGYMDMINGRGVNAHQTNEVTVDGVRFYKDKLNAFAATLANVVNSIMPEVTLDANGVATPVSGQYREFLASADGSPITAANITISTSWAQDKGLIIYESGNLSNDYLLHMKTALNSESYTFKGTGEISDGLFTGTFFDFVQDYITTQGAQTKFHQERLTATNEITLNILDQRDSISGVNQDEETVSMMAYQRMFQACSRLMTTMDEALDVLINRTGMVGR
ncbi:MAG: flagellar hook-associated protein FlgK [Provencibacterium sp.]|jgi:flagellar hook-associated protein 1 FlgK|nr:flagellar hook-associated protein FlgK [Provencibacterium sp.]